jgi:hypothetical protein
VGADLFRRYGEFIGQLVDALPRFRDLDERFFHFLTEETTPRPLPADFDLASWSYRPTPATRTLREGDKGGTGRARPDGAAHPGAHPGLHLPAGRAQRRAVRRGHHQHRPIYAQAADSDVEAFARSARRLAELADSVRVVYVPHFTRYAVDPLFLAEVADGFERLAAREAALHPNQDYLGYPVQEASFERFSIFVAAPGEEQAL